MTSPVFDLGPMPVRIDVDAALVRRLVAAQFPRWAGLPVRPVATSGWDNRSFRLGDDMLVRLPSAVEYALAVGKEHRWLPELARHLPLPVPRPLARGVPGEGYPCEWSVYGWIGGEPVTGAPIADLAGFAADLAGFLTALQAVDPAGGPGPGKHNWFRGGPLSVWDGRLAEALARSDGRVDRAAVTAVWRRVRAVRWDGRPVWVHGDVAAGNLLLSGGRLAAVIDFGGIGVGDPACDLAVAWTLLTGPSRRVFRSRLGVDDGTWERGRGWALWKSVVDGDHRTVDEVLQDAG